MSAPGPFGSPGSLSFAAGSSGSAPGGCGASPLRSSFGGSSGSPDHQAGALWNAQNNYSPPQRYDFQPTSPPQLTSPSSQPRSPAVPQSHHHSLGSSSPWSLNVGSLGGGNWMGSGQFVFDAGPVTVPDSPSMQHESPQTPVGWQMSSGAASLAWKRLRHLDWLQGESLFSLPLPAPLRKNDFGAVAARSVPSRVAGENSSARTPTEPESQVSSFHNTPLNSKAEFQSLLSQSRHMHSETQLRKPAPHEDTLLDSVHKSFQSTWQMLMSSVESISGNWCMHESNDVPSYTSQHGFFQTRHGLERIRGLGMMAWSVRTTPPRMASAQTGGSPSPMLALRAPLVQEAMESSIASEDVARADASWQGPKAVQQSMPQQEIARALGGVSCSVFSMKGNKATAPNQDRAVYASLGPASTAELLAVLDGHGEVGHDVADVCAEVLPKLLLQRMSKFTAPAGVAGTNRGMLSSHEGAGAPLADTWKQAAIQSFEEMHASLEALTTQAISGDDHVTGEGARGLGKVDARVSGTTATVVLVMSDQRMLVAHVGDSRAVLGVRRRGEGHHWRCQDLTRDHKPDLPDERARIELCGAQVVTVGSPPNSTCRVYTAQQAWPSINMSRSLGDLHAHSQGLSAEAEANFFESLWDPACEDAVLILGSDGIWDVIDGETAMSMVSSSAQQGSDPAIALAQEAYQRWSRRGLQANYSDDISAVVKFL
eukprot:TRINITY_DN29085_c0_g1_i1.p1 TRINITY_DN29085_c0_g1~~TRINITY_DN29085_c0_g1_i1.p1  ORF type:complete len:711 (-),score=101.46 TRINITY_DN29085_c0_g1_i1:104-2236(-)